MLKYFQRKSTKPLKSRSLRAHSLSKHFTKLVKNGCLDFSQHAVRLQVWVVSASWRRYNFIITLLWWAIYSKAPYRPYLSKRSAKNHWAIVHLILILNCAKKVAKNEFLLSCKPWGWVYEFYFTQRHLNVFYHQATFGQNSPVSYTSRYHSRT